VSTITQCPDEGAGGTDCENKGKDATMRVSARSKRFMKIVLFYLLCAE
jgi:hypothetical protein